ncbi:hypothetical protein BG011_009422 [Mortierella polycephala]|uniref:PH domain-containing protein n=1 Tax=Mortierella polycephala TaxID=41804 RepID=A0A9P6Q9M6_9FUNG|nr:hypothetical protein BG011_009422 [Mortierella polycephala]
MEVQHLQPPSTLASLQTIDQARAELEARLVGIHNDLQLTQTIGLLFVKRQEDLKSCFDQLQGLKQQQQQQLESDNYHSEISTQLPETLREQLVLLDKEFQEGQNGILGLKGLIDAQLPTIEIQPPQNDSVLGPSALPSSALPAQTISKPRRHKVVVPSTPSIHDPAFPVQIQEELLNQVRYWTSQAEMKEKLNQEYDTKITEQERIIDALNKQRRMREESDERQKEDQWNLELMNQELRSQSSELQQQLSKATHENSKIQSALAVASEQVEQLKDKEERTAGQLELTKSRHEQDMMTMRKHTAGIQREKSDLLKKVEDLNSTLTQQQQKLAKMATMEAIARAQEVEEQEPESPVEAPVLIQAPPRLPSNEEITSLPVVSTPVIEPKVASLARETSFAHQQSIISELQSKLSKEITEKEELVTVKEELLSEKEELIKMLADCEETIETLRFEGTMTGIDPIGALPGSGTSQPDHTFGHVSESSNATINRHLVEQTAGADGGLSELADVKSSDPTLAGGLFAELAHANKLAEPLTKPTVEYKDQGVMTEPIESWIHTIPGFAPIAAEKAEVLTKSMATNTNASTSMDNATNTDASISVDSATNTDTSISVDNATNTDASASVDNATNTEASTLVDNATNTKTSTSVDIATETEASTLDDNVADTKTSTLVDNATNTKASASVDIAAKTETSTLDDNVANTKTSTLVDSATNMKASASVGIAIETEASTSNDNVANTKAPTPMDNGTNTETSIQVENGTNTETSIQVDNATNTETSTLVDNATNTENSTLVDNATNTETSTLVDNATNTDAKTLVDHATNTEVAMTSTNVDSVLSSVPQTDATNTPAPLRKNGQLPGIVTGKATTTTMLTSVQDSQYITTPTVAGLEVASLRVPEILDQAQDIGQVKPVEPAFVESYSVNDSVPREETKVMKDLELDVSAPVPRFLHSDVPLDDERRHTCDMSQVIPESPMQSIPPVPSLPKDIVQSRPNTLITTTGGQDFRVSFGSAFGDADGSPLTTGRIEPVYSPVGHHATSSHEHDNDHEQHRSDAKIAGQSPGRPITGPPSMLLARAARASSMASELGAPFLSESAMYTDGNDSNSNNNSSNSNSNSKSTINHTHISAVGISGYHNLSNHNLNINNAHFQATPPISYPPRSASIRSMSMRSEKNMMSSSPPPSSHSRPPMATGAAVISSTTRTAYTFNSTSSQVHIPQSQQQQQPQHQHITDSSGASIGRHRYRHSPSGSFSSMSTDYGNGNGRRSSIGSNCDGGSSMATDPTMIQVITQTMIGDYLWKYTRRPMASVISEKKHKRYFWVHPYTKTMYWSLNNPAADGSREQRAKSALITAVFQITDEAPTGNSELPNVSLLVQTSSRNLKLTAPTRQKHELWYQSLSYLLSRPTAPGADIPSDNQTWSEVQATRSTPSDTLLTIRNDKPVNKKGSFNRLHNMFGRSRDNSPSGSPHQTSAPGSALNSGVSSTSVNLAGLPGGTINAASAIAGYPTHMANPQGSVGGYGTVNGGPIMARQGQTTSSSIGTNNSLSPKSRQQHEDDYHYNDGEAEYEEDEDGELPEHVRQCCDGKHDVGTLGHRHH